MDNDSHRPQGIFAASHSLLDSEALDSAEWRQLREILIWFNKHLPHPPKTFAAGRAIFWFKSGADESIRRIWEMVHLLRQHSNVVEIYRCRHLANILYEDEFQVAAYPSKRDSEIKVR